MPDSTWLMTMYGNFVSDTIIPYDSDARKETKYMQRTFIVSSDDKGNNWHYVSTVAAPLRGDPVGEGLVEPALTMLTDGTASLHNEVRSSLSPLCLMEQ